MMAYAQKLLITALLLFAIADECKGKKDDKEMVDPGKLHAGCSCQAPGNRADVFFKDKNNEIPCTKNQGENLYTYGSEDYGLEIFTYIDTSKMNYKVPSSGGIFTCTSNNMPMKSNDLCHSHKTFIIPPANDAHENKDHATYMEGENVTLHCHVNLSVSYTLLWIAIYSNGSTKCLSSVEVLQQTDSFNSSKDTLCCPSQGIYQRISKTLPHHYLDIKNFTTLPHHYLDIENFTTSNSGEYLCIGFFYGKGGHSWKRANKTFIHVTNEDTKFTAYIVYGTIGGLAALGAILCLVILCIKYKGKQMKVNQRYFNAPPTEYECTPYAVSIGQDNNSHAGYSKEQEPMSETGAEYSEVELTPLAACVDVKYSKIGRNTQAEPSSEYSEVSMEPHCVYSKIGERPLVIPNKESSVLEVKQVENSATYSVLN